MRIKENINFYGCERKKTLILMDAKEKRLILLGAKERKD
jgi:hypothetical protein